MAMARSPLDPAQRQIRLLHLHPRRDQESARADASGMNCYDSQVSCSFSVVSLNNRPRYEALSYAWGQDPADKQILIEGLPYLVTTNLFLALRNLQHDQDDRVLWIDALCIDQSDTLERTLQVSLMDCIYSQASKVVAWLGETSETHEAAMDFIELFGGDKDLHFHPSVGRHITVRGMDLTSPDLRAHVTRFFALPWWERLWTVQEYVLASDVLFQSSSRTLGQETFIQAYGNVKTHLSTCCADHFMLLGLFDPNSKLSIFRAFDRFSDLYNTRLGQTNFLSLLALYRSRSASDSRDKVYGMLGIAPREYQELIRPDYTILPAHVFESTLVAIIQHMKSLHILSQLCLPASRTMSLPSFVVDWTIKLAMFERAYLLNRTWPLLHYKASETLAEFKDLGPGKLWAKGVIFDRVAQRLPATGERLQRIETWRAMANINEDHVRIYPGSNIDVQTAFWLTLCGGIVTDKDRQTLRRADATVDFPLYQHWYKWISISNYKGDTHFDSDVILFNNHYTVAVFDRTFIITEKGYFGLAPKEVLKGDLVVILDGGPVPYILRPASVTESDSEGGNLEHSTKYYNILGDSYIQGVMHGEATNAFRGAEHLEANKSEFILV